MTYIQDYTIRGRNFSIVKKDGVFCAIEDKYIDSDGKLNQPLTGVHLHTGTTFEDCLGHLDTDTHIDQLMESGMTKVEAFAAIFNLPLKVCRNLFNEE